MARRQKRLTRLVIGAVAVVAIGYAGVKAYLWFQASNGMEQIADRLDGIAALDWQGVEANVAGDITIRDLIIRPVGVEDNIRIAAVRLQVSGVNRLAELARRFDEGDVPDSARVLLDGAAMDVADPLYQALTRFAGGQLWGTPLDALACGDAQALHTAVIQALDYRELITDIELRLQHQPRADRAAVFATVNFRRIGESRIAAYFETDALAASDVRQDPAALGALALSSLQVRYADTGFNEARNFYCAAELDTDVATFLDRHVDAVRTRIPDAGNGPFLPLYREYARYGGDVRIDLEPDSPLALTALQALTAADAVTTLHPRLAINGRQLTLADGQWRALMSPGAGTGLAAAEDTTETSTGSADGPRTVAPEALVDQLGRTARIVTRDGKSYTGRLTEADKRAVTVAVPMQGGTVSYPIELERIERAELMNNR